MIVPTPSGRRLLLVEDDPMVRETIILMLEEDYDVFHAGSVSAALERMRAGEGSPST